MLTHPLEGMVLQDQEMEIHRLLEELPQLPMQPITEWLNPKQFPFHKPSLPRMEALQLGKEATLEHPQPEGNQTHTEDP
jgi:hypothetical protein